MKIQVENIRIEFENGTTQTFSAVGAAKKHCRENGWIMSDYGNVVVLKDRQTKNIIGELRWDSYQFNPFTRKMMLRKV